MRFDIDAIDLVSVFLGFLMIGLFSGVLMIVGILFGISLITSVGLDILVGIIVFGVMFMIWYGILIVYDGLKWCF
jgi:arginine exporter protein ArgO